MNIYDEDYAKKVYEWIDGLDDFKDVDTIEKSFYMAFLINFPPFDGIAILAYSNRILFFKRNCFFKVYYSRKVEYSIECSKHRELTCIKTEKFWMYREENKSFKSIITSFGMDMTMPFLTEQKWKSYDRFYRVSYK